MIFPEGSYQAVAGGYTSKIVTESGTFVFTFKNGVRGINIKDTITISKVGTVVSNILGEGGVIKSFEFLSKE